MLDEQKQQLIQSSRLLIPNRGDKKAIKQLTSDGGSESSLELSLTSVASTDSLIIGKCATVVRGREMASVCAKVAYSVVCDLFLKDLRRSSAILKKSANLPGPSRN